MAFVRSEQGTEMTPAPVAVKFIIAGGFGVGKTTFVGSVSEITPLRTEGAMTATAMGIDDASLVSEKVSTTVAMDFGRITIDEELVMYLFGTPGQTRFGFMWDDIVEGALGALVLADPRRLNDCYPAIDYFEERDIPFVVVLNHFDTEYRPDLDAVRYALNIDPRVPFVDCDARNRDSVKTALLSMLDHLLNQIVASSETAQTSPNYTSSSPGSSS